MPNRAVAMPIEVGSVNECGLAYPSPVRRGNAFGRAAYPSPAKRGRVGERSEPGWGIKFARHGVSENPTRPASLRSAGHPPLRGGITSDRCNAISGSRLLSILASPRAAALIELPTGRGGGCRNADRMAPHVKGNTHRKAQPSRVPMSRPRMRRLAAALAAAMLLAATQPIVAQTPEQKPTEKPPAADGKDPQKKIDEFAEAEKLLGGPAANPECLWLGRRVVSLLWRDDLDTAFRHLDLYDRFGCPAGHIQAAFRCVIKQGEPDPKATDAIGIRVRACWINPSAEMQGTAAVPSGTTNR